MQMRLTATIAPLKNSNFEIVLFSFRTLKTALQKQCYLCQKLPLPIPFHTWKISCFEHIACVFFHSHVFWHINHVKQLTALNKSFSVQNNIYRDNLCFAYYICAYLRDK